MSLDRFIFDVVGFTDELLTDLNCFPCKLSFDPLRGSAKARVGRQP